MESDPTNATLTAREDLTDILSIVRVRPDAGRVPPFVPGQFFRLGLPRPEAPAAGDGEGRAGRLESRPGRVRYTRRAYSVASSPRVTDQAEFLVVRVEEGALTPRLWELYPGDRLWMDSEAKGEFTIDHAPRDADLVMVATGTGVAPFMSMLRTFRGEGRWRRFVLIHGVRFAADLAYRAELEIVAQEDPTVKYIPLVTRADPAENVAPSGGVAVRAVAGWTGLRGRVQVALEPTTYARLVGAPLDPQRCHVFLCGNPRMIDDVQVELEQRGFVTDSRQQRGHLHFERYW